MPESRPLPVWAGRTTALLGIVLVAFTLRQAVAALSPILGDIRVDIPISNVGVGVLGTLPPILFAGFGLFAPRIARILGLDRSIVLALALIVAGNPVRAVAPDFAVLLLGSIVAFAGTGIGNVLLPSVLRRYFADRVALLTGVYVCVVGVSTAVPAALAAPLAQGAGWRFSLGIWSSSAVVALVPWLVLLVRQRRLRLTDAAPVDTPPTVLLTHLWRSRVAVSITILFSSSAVCTYAAFAWLPEILGGVAKSTPTEAGVLLAVTGLVSVPGALLVPLAIARLRHVGWLIVAGVASFVVGYLGLLVAPQSLTLLWVLFIGAGSVLFPTSLVLMNTRTRSHGGTVALSGFAQGIGYAMGALGPLIVGLLHDADGGWTLPLVFLIVVALVALVPAVTLVRPALVEDELTESGSADRQGQTTR